MGFSCNSGRFHTTMVQSPARTSGRLAYRGFLRSNLVSFEDAGRSMPFVRVAGSVRAADLVEVGKVDEVHGAESTYEVCVFGFIRKPWMKIRGGHDVWGTVSWRIRLFK